ncbi:MAG: N-acetylneuraminate synthase family protein [Planctomycetota bacterium]
MKIGDRHIGPKHPPYIIAEIGVNHDGDPDRAVMLTESAARAGADAVKLQLFETDRLMSKAARLAAYQKSAGETDPFAMLRRLELSIDQMAPSVERAHELGIHAIVTVFSVELVEVAEQLPWDAYKSASPDVVNRPLLEAMAATGKPLIVSTGASTLDEVTRAAGWLDGIRDRLTMLQCVSSYPAPDAALGGIRAIAEATGLPVGYSDHTASIETGAMAVAAGAALLERHVTYDTSAAGPDHGASLEPVGFERYADRARAATRSTDQSIVDKRVLACEQDVRAVSRQSLVAVRNLAAGAVLTLDDLTIKRPGTGIEPWRVDEVVGATVARDIEADMPLIEEDLS